MPHRLFHLRLQTRSVRLGIAAMAALGLASVARPASPATPAIAPRETIALFNGKANCAACHPSTPDPRYPSVGPLFTDFTYDNLGIPKNPKNPFYTIDRALNPAGAGYVDKTPFLGELLADPAQVVLFPRPRRFGKTLNLSTLAYFLGKSDEDLSPLFQDLAVWSDPGARAHFQQHPVLFLTFKDIKTPSYETTREAIRSELQGLYAKHRYLLDEGALEPHERPRFERILYLDGVPNLQRLDAFAVGETVVEQLQLALELEKEAVALIDKMMAACVEEGDTATREWLAPKMLEEQTHIDWLETQLTLHSQIGDQHYLAQQVHD